LNILLGIVDFFCFLCIIKEETKNATLDFKSSKGQMKNHPGKYQVFINFQMEVFLFDPQNS